MMIIALCSQNKTSSYIQRNRHKIRQFFHMCLLCMMFNLILYHCIHFMTICVRFSLFIYKYLTILAACSGYWHTYFLLHFLQKTINRSSSSNLHNFASYSFLALFSMKLFYVVHT